MKVREVMTTPAETVSADETLHDAIGQMLTHRIGSVVVVDAGLVGILTRSDALRAAYYKGQALDELPVKVGMSRDVVTTKPTTSVQFALETMEDNDIKKLPVVDGLDLVGVVTVTDIARHHPKRALETRQSIKRRDEWTDYTDGRKS